MEPVSSESIEESTPRSRSRGFPVAWIIFAGYLLVILIVGSLGWEALSQINSLKMIHHKMMSVHRLQIDLGEAKLAQAQMLDSVGKFLLSASEDAKMEPERQDRFFHDEIEEQAASEFVAPIIPTVDAAHNRLHRLMGEAIALHRKGDTAAAHKLFASKITDQAQRILTILNQAEMRAMASEKNWMEQSAELEKQLFMRTYALLILAILIGLALGLGFTRLLTRPIGRLAGEAGEIADGNLKALSGSRSVIREINQLSRSLSEMVEALEKEIDLTIKHSRAKSIFLAHMSHEVRTPLNSVIGFAQIMQRDNPALPEETARRYAHNIEKSGRYLLGLINDTLDIVRIEAGRMELNYAPLDLKHTLADLREMLHPLAEEKEIELQVDAGPNLRIVADGSRVSQVVLNLVNNAIKFTAKGGTVTVRTQKKGKDIHIAVEDNGVGIPDADLERIFLEFEQAGNPLHRGTTGAGLGLPLARKLVELHGGRMWVKSHVGRGSAFHFTLPIRPEEAEAA